MASAPTAFRSTPSSAPTVRKGARRFHAVVEAWLPGGKHVQGIIRDGDARQVGWEWNGELRDPGPVEKRNARAACTSL